MPGPTPTSTRPVVAHRASVVTRALAVGLTALLAGCGGEEPVVLAVDEVGFTESELVGLTESRRALLQHLTALALVVSDEAVGETIAPLLEVERADRLHLLVEAERTVAEAGIGTAELEARYAASPAWELTVRHLIVMSARREQEDTRAAARAKAERALARIRAGEPFPEVAAEVSEEPGAEGRQGLLTPGREGAWVDEFWSAASALEVGDISEVVETQYGFHVLKLEGREVVPFEEARGRFVLELARGLGLGEVSTADAPRPSEVTFAPDVRTATEPEAVLASWAEGEVRWSDLLRRAAAEGGESWDALTAGDAEVRARMLDLELAEGAAVAAARGMGLAVEAAWEEERVRELSWPIEQAAQLLGIPPTLPRSRVAEVALQALGRSGQNADLARDDVRRWRGLLDHRYRYTAAWAETDTSDAP